MREHNVGVPIPVHVGKRRAAADDRFKNVRATFLRWSGHETASPATAARVPEQLRGLAVVLARLHFFDVRFDVPVGRQQIEPAVQIVVEEKYAERERLTAGRADASRDGFIGERQWIIL